MALPVLAILRRLGVRHPGLMWVAVAIVGLPMGHVLGSPAVFVDGPTAEQIEHGLYWSDMLIYMTLFGFSGLTYSYFLRGSQSKLSE
jgi:hypothetical protein